MTSYLEYSDEQLRRERWLLDAEVERRRLAEHSKQLAESQPDATDLEYVEYLWASMAGGSLTDSEECKQAVRWLWAATWLAHDAQYGRAPTVAHLGRVLVEHLEALALGGGGEDTTDVRDYGDPPSFGGRGCRCSMYDDGGPESGPRLGVDLHEECPLHSHLLEGAVPDVPWPGEEGGYRGSGVTQEAWQALEAAHDEATLCRVHEAGACPPGCPDAYEHEPTTTTKEIS